MNNDVTRCIEILTDAIAFEEEGIRFFSTRAESTTSPMERNIFSSLAKDEQGHRAHLIGLRDELIRTHNLEPLGKTDDDHERTARQIFETAMEEVKDPTSTSRRTWRFSRAPWKSSARATRCTPPPPPR